MAKKSKSTSQKSNKTKQTPNAVSGYSTDGSLFKNIPLKDLKKKRNSPMQTDPAIPKDPEDTMTPEEVAALIKRTVRRVSFYRREGLLKKFWKFRDGRILYSRIGVEEFLQDHFFQSEDL
ncbi:helix-turn-helix domain-containing protein [Leptospira stimsonii]|uniref:DNA-binding protein n=1 Tax=Leptospira stimsonii TaxID=2202203 RepID=A0A396Z305_9LEPT|nr:helix-turn-helix domain-containing protein [Leptospira stimsonii]RHX89869.1 DNA-binding protein [Leptospira stimsonii]